MKARERKAQAVPCLVSCTPHALPHGLGTTVVSDKLEFFTLFSCDREVGLQKRFESRAKTLHRAAGTVRPADGGGLGGRAAALAAVTAAGGVKGTILLQLTMGVYLSE